MERIVIGMDVAFVEDAEHEVDRGQRRGNQEGLAAERILIGLRGAGEHGLDGGRQADLAGGVLDGVDGIAQRDAGLQVERDGDRREQTLVVHGERRHGRAVMRDGAQAEPAGRWARARRSRARSAGFCQYCGAASITT